MLMKKGDLYFPLEKYDEAISAYRQLTIDYPKSERAPIAAYWIGISNMKKGDNVAAGEAFEELSTSYPNHNYGTLAVMRLGDLRMDEGRFEEAVSYYDRIASSRSNETVGFEASYKKAIALLKSGKTEKAEADFRDLIARQPSDIMSHKARIELAEIAITRGDGDAAVSLAETVIEQVVDENAARAQYIIGKRYFAEEDFQRAYDELLRCTIIYKSYDEWVSRAKLLMAKSQNELGKKDDALKTLDEVLEAHQLDDIGKEAILIKNEIEN